MVVPTDCALLIYVVHWLERLDFPHSSNLAQPAVMLVQEEAKSR